MISPEDLRLWGLKEADIQVALFRLRDNYIPQYPILRLFRGSADGEVRDHKVNLKTGNRYSPTGSKLKKMGVLPHWPDTYCPVARHGYHAFFVELKRPGERPTAEQYAVMDMLRSEGNFVDWFDQWVSAWNKLVWYLGLPDEIRVK